MDIVKKVNESLGTSFVIVTHNFEVAARTHRRIILRDGQIEREEDV